MNFNQDSIEATLFTQEDLNDAKTLDAVQDLISKSTEAIRNIDGQTKTVKAAKPEDFQTQLKYREQLMELKSHFTDFKTKALSKYKKMKEELTADFSEKEKTIQQVIDTFKHFGLDYNIFQGWNAGRVLTDAEKNILLTNFVSCIHLCRAYDLGLKNRALPKAIELINAEKAKGDLMSDFAEEPFIQYRDTKINKLFNQKKAPMSNKTQNQAATQSSNQSKPGKKKFAGKKASKKADRF